MYYSETINITFPAVVCFICLYIQGIIPVYAAIKMKNTILIIVSVICAILSLWAVPPLISIILVSMKLPRDIIVNTKKWLYTGFWIFLAVVFLLLPILSMGGFGLTANVNGLNLLGISGSAAGFYTAESGAIGMIPVYLVICIIGAILGPTTKGRSLYMGQLILKQLSCGALALISLLLFGFSGMSRYIGVGIYITLLAQFAGAIWMFYLTHLILSNIDGGDIKVDVSKVVPFIKEKSKTLMDTVKETGSKVNKTKESYPESLVIRCSTCGRDLKPAQKFCPSCGTAAPTKKDTTMPQPLNQISFKCGKCGLEAKSGQKFCGKCGGTIVQIRIK